MNDAPYYLRKSLCIQLLEVDQMLHYKYLHCILVIFMHVASYLDLDKRTFKDTDSILISSTVNVCFINAICAVLLISFQHSAYVMAGRDLLYIYIYISSTVCTALCIVLRGLELWYH